MHLRISLAVLGTLIVASIVTAQPPPGQGRRGDGPGPGGPGGDSGAFINRLLELDANKDGKLQKDEVKDARVQPLFERADGDKDGVVTREELQALAQREGGRGPGQGGPGQGGPGGRGVGGQGGPGFGGGRFGGPPRPGEILPPFLQDELRLSQEQRKQLLDLQQEVTAKLDKILTAEQKRQMEDLRNRGPGGPGFGPRDGGGGQPGQPNPEARPRRPQ